MPAQLFYSILHIYQGNNYNCGSQIKSKINKQKTPHSSVETTLSKIKVTSTRGLLSRKVRLPAVEIGARQSAKLVNSLCIDMLVLGFSTVRLLCHRLSVAI